MRERLYAGIQKHPYLFVVLVSGLFRLIAVIWSKGFLHTDDHFETVVISHNWLIHGLFGADGLLHWGDQPASEITRFPLYTFFLFALMKVQSWLGMSSLGSMMYGVRLVHALLSLLPVIFTYKAVKVVTRDDRWAMIGGLFAGLHFALPFLGVRNLIEVVGGELWVVSLYAFYRYVDDSRARWLYLAGVMTGLAWMIRFQIALAALPIPFVLWYDHRSLKPVVHYCLAVAVMILLSWTADYLLLGRFAGSTLIHLNLHVFSDTMYDTIPALYIVVLVFLFIPPLSLILVWLAARPSFVARHKIIVLSTLSFLICHWFLRNQQERFILPMAPACILLFTLALWDRWRAKGYILPRRNLFSGLAIGTIAVNLVLLVVLSISAPRRGLVEPLVRLSEENPAGRALYLQPNMRGWVPDQYGVPTLSLRFIRDWHEWGALRHEGADLFEPDRFVIYPTRDDGLQACIDSLQAVYGALTPDFHIGPSPYDWILHALNPGHNNSYEAWVYRRAGDGYSTVR